MIRSGVDIIEIERIERAVWRHGERFYRRFFTVDELEAAGTRQPALAVRFAAKEAVAKALGTGIGDVSWKDIEILNGPRREPSVRLSGAALQLANKLGLTDWSVSLSHTHRFAVAFVVAASGS
jgi:holo-[acyl-carrier protein] synthase